MIVAIPTIKQNLLPRRFGHMTEITFLEIIDGKVKREFHKEIEKHHNKKEKKEDNPRHQEIINSLNNCDVLWYKSLCKNWRKRLQFVKFDIKRINDDTLEEVKMRVNHL